MNKNTVDSFVVNYLSLIMGLEQNDIDKFYKDFFGNMNKGIFRILYVLNFPITILISIAIADLINKRPEWLYFLISLIPTFILLCMFEYFINTVIVWIVNGFKDQE